MQSVLAQNHGDFILYVVDNASADDTLAKVARYRDARVRVIQSGANIGFAAGCNSGMRAAFAEDCSHVLLINNDTVFDPSLISGLLAAEAQLGADITVPKILRHDAPGVIWAAGGGFRKLRGYASFHIGEDERDTGQYSTPQRIDFACGCCVLLNRAAVERLGWLDERYFVYTEDADYSWRAGQLGMKL